jgi:electron transport complex protein RnfC
VGTLFAVYEAVALGKNCYERVVTVTGRGINRPANLLCRIGTAVEDIAAHLGGFKPETVKCVSGGPMMGFALADLSLTVTKTMSGLLFMTRDETDLHEYGPCIRCGRCISVCPMGLQPNEISIFMERERYKGTEQFGLWDCFECGTCAFVCPAKRPLVQFIRTAKMKHKSKG